MNSNSIPVRVPSVWMCHTFRHGWLNLAKIRKLQICSDIKNTPAILITWDNGDDELFKGDDAELILRDWKEAANKYIHPFERN
jgi:hypothetical protein